MKQFFKFFAYGIIFSGILLFLSYLLDFAPLDKNNGNIFSNAFITALLLVLWGVMRIQGNAMGRPESTDILYGVKIEEIRERATEYEKLSQSRIPSALALFLVAAANLALSWFL
ncbi:hypothetical protein [Spirochaeta isovalerica]|uniref:Uncharacterized protein n=1 Tax=Spirochaeta isovalerica TaxID=150 RepID=A0A841R894_9SPIO|nr:hypothetical protein [Spirochaeta isovalerica]MBB6480105.1 hypothetical protein [Spirochaeta isovalerica]